MNKKYIAGFFLGINYLHMDTKPTLVQAQVTAAPVTAEPIILTPEQETILKATSDYVTAGGDGNYYWQVNPIKLAKYLSSKQALLDNK